MTSTMSHPAYPIIEPLVTTLAVCITSILTMLLASVTTGPDAEELKWLLIPLISSMIVSGGAILLNPALEDRKIVIGRSVISMFCGAVSPQFTAILFPSYAPLLAHAVILFGCGGVAAGIAYILSRPLFEGAYRRSKVTADFILKQGQDKLMGSMKTAVESVVDDKVVPMVDEKVVKAINKRADGIEANQAGISTQISNP